MVAVEHRRADERNAEIEKLGLPRDNKPNRGRDAHESGQAGSDGFQDRAGTGEAPA